MFRPLRRAGEQISNLDLSPPDWIVQLLDTQDTTIPYRDMVRAALSVGVPLGLGYAVGQLPYGVLASLGTLPGMLADRGGPLSDRFRRAVAGLIAGVAGLILGHVLGETGWTAIVVVAALALFAGLISPVGATTSFAALQLLVYLAIGSGFVLAMPAYEFSLLFLAGGAWAILLSTIQALGEGISSPETDAVAGVYRAIADLLLASGSEVATDVRQQLTAALNTAYDQVVGARSRAHGRDSHLRWLGNMLNAAMSVAEASVAMVHAGMQVPNEEIREVTRLASAVSGGPPVAALPASNLGESPQLRALRDTIVHACRQLHARMDPPEARESMVHRMQRAIEAVLALVTARGNWAYALRVGLCMTVAETAREVLPIERPYWILLTVAIVVKPDLGSVFARAVQRGGGTVVGVVVGAILLAVLPAGPPVLLAIMILAGLLPFAIRRNYGLLATFITPLALMLIELATKQGTALVISRLEATLIGCGIVLVLGYLLWPETWHARVGDRVSESIGSMTAYLGAAFTAGDGERTDRRRAAYRGLSELRTALQRMLSEPPPFNRQAAAWWPVVNGLERVADAVTEASVAAREQNVSPAAKDVRTLIASLEGLRNTLGGGKTGPVQTVAQPPEIADPALSGIRDEIAGVVGLVGA